MRFEINSAFEADVFAVIALYKKRTRRDELGFASELMRAIESIRSQPRLYSPVDDGLPGFEVREKFISRFSQRVLYLIDDDRVVVFALIHASRRPAAWHRRLDQLP